MGEKSCPFIVDLLYSVFQTRTCEYFNNYFIMTRNPFYVIIVMVYAGGCVLPCSGQRIKRSTSCAQKYQMIPYHSACLSKSDNAIKSGVSDGDKNVIVNEHNKYRAGVSPTAVQMGKMSWDDEIAMVAQTYADACKGLVHDGNQQRSIPGRFSVGQNLASAGNDLSWAEVIKLWYDEVKDFTMGGPNELRKVGHFTQVVWSTSIKIGCGFAQCGSTRSYVCNYGPSGNYDINNPYMAGTACSNCSSTCSNNLCDCGSKACENGGTMNFNRCSCTCSGPSYIAPSCQLNCTGHTDSYFCGTGYFIQSNCDRYSNVPILCPTMCKVCPCEKQNSRRLDSI
ncbi:cysteine-rich venom protein Mr30-like isoform X2 [Crassostrea virginica]